MDKIIEKYNYDNNYEDLLNSLKNFTFKEKIPGFKIERKLDDEYINIIIKNLEKIPEIKNKKILYDENFIKSFYKIFWNLLSRIAIATENFYIFLPFILYNLNRFTIEDYVINDCRSTDNYNCGRAMSIIKEGVSRFLIYNSINGQMDTKTQLLYLQGCNHLNEEEEEEGMNYSNRIIKEIELLKKEFIVELKGKKILLKKGEYRISFILPKEYPRESPFGFFNGRSISEVDINWFPQRRLIDIANELIIKYESNLMPVLRIICDY